MKQPLKQGQCRSCKYHFELRDVATATIQMECWRNPPSVSIVAMHPNGSIQTQSYRPPVSPVGVCGEYEFGVGYESVEVVGQPSPIAQVLQS